LTKSSNPTYSYDDYAKELKERLRTTNWIAREHIIKAKLTAKQQYDKDAKAISFKLGDKIHIAPRWNSAKRSIEKIRYIMQDHMKLWEIINYKIKIEQKIKCIHVNRLKAFIEH